MKKTSPHAFRATSITGALTLSTLMMICGVVPATAGLFDFIKPKPEAKSSPLAEASSSATVAGLPETYKNALTPSDGVLRRGWPLLFADPELHRLLALVDTQNQALVAAGARRERALASVQAAVSALSPTVSASGDVSRSRFSTTPRNAFPNPLQTLYRGGVQVAYEVDVWGRLRSTVEATRADVRASEATWAMVRLSLLTDTTIAYMTLRGIEAERAVLAQSVTRREESLKLTEDRLKAGTGTELEVARAETELSAAKIELTALAKARGELENALALLIGQPASAFRLAGGKGQLAIPQVPVGVPSELLARRPDVAAATASLQASQARLKAARTTWFPRVLLGAASGREASDLDRLDDEASRSGTISLGLTLPLWDGGLRSAQIKAAEATQDENIATQQQIILGAFQEVENALNALRIQVAQQRELEGAKVSAAKAASLSLQRFQSGLVPYLEVIETDRTVLAVERAAVQLQAQRLISAVSLIKALGGGWADPAPVSPGSRAASPVSQ